MKYLIILIGIIAAMACTNNSTPPKKEAPVSDSLNKVLYQCPMKDDGDKTYTTAGTCPVCGMDLEKIK